jgi:protein-disulfide isomerase
VKHLTRPTNRSLASSTAPASRIRRTAGWLGPLLALVVVAVLAALSARPSEEGGMSAEGQTGNSRSGGGGGENPFAALVRRQEGDPTARGPVDAPIVMIEYADFQCPFCGRFARQTEPRLIQEYVDKGLLRIEWRDLPYLGPESRTAAAAARAAAVQGRFWEFHDALYAEERRVNSGALNASALRAIAASVGLDVARFEADSKTAVARDAIARDEQEATSLGITGTPAFIVAGTPIIGAQPYEEFKRVIDEALTSR